MLAAVLPGLGQPLAIERIPVPQPRRGELLVRVAACGVCHTDLHVLKGEVAFPVPAVLGHEISGTVAALGESVVGPPVGVRVVGTFIMPCGACSHCERGRDDLCSQFFELNRLRGALYDGETRLQREDGTPLAMYSMGGLAEYAVVPEHAIFALPDSLPLEESAIIGCAALTAYGAVMHGGETRVGDHVAVVATGGVGSMIVQVARAEGAAQVVAVDLGSEKLAAALALGATDAVDAGSEDAVARVIELTGGGADVVFEVLGSERTFTQALAMVRDGGRLVAVGIAPAGVTAPVEITRLVRRSIHVIGSYGARVRADMPAILALVESGAISPAATLTRRFALADAAEAYAALDRREIIGRAIIVMPGD
jgi:S-(hydroxymethyl)glutathione dehydrogenase/alcohol dehydrogenase